MMQLQELIGQPGRLLRRAGVGAALVTVLWLSLAGRPAAVQGGQRGPASSSSAVLTPDGRRLLVAFAELDSLVVIDTASHRRVTQIPVGREPAGVALAPGSQAPFAYVANRGSHSVSVVDLDGMRQLGEISVGLQPSAVLVSADGRHLYVANRLSAEIAVLETGSFQTVASLPVPADPSALSLSPEGDWLYVVHLRPGLVSRLDTASLQLEGIMELGPRSYLATALLVQGGQGYVLHSLQPEDGAAGPQPAYSVLDLQAFRVLRAAVPLSTSDPRPDLPRAGFPDGEQGLLWLAAAGSDELVAVDPASGEALARIRTGYQPEAVVSGADGTLLYVANGLGPTVTVVERRQRQVVLTVPAGVPPYSQALLEGKRRFYSGRLLETQWGSACGTCHLGGEGDGRVWEVGGAGLNTPVLWAVGRTRPWGWGQSWSSLEAAVAHALPLRAPTGAPIGGQPPSLPYPEVLAFLSSLEMPAEHGPVLGPAAQRGRAVFQSLGCGQCHSGEAYTDGLLHRLGAGGFYDTPTLLGLAGSAPYLHDGRAPTLAQAVREHTAVSLAPAEEADLVEFLRSLPHRPAPGPAGPGSGLRTLLDQLLGFLGWLRGLAGPR